MRSRGRPQAGGTAHRPRWPDTAGDRCCIRWPWYGPRLRRMRRTWSRRPRSCARCRHPSRARCCRRRHSYARCLRRRRAACFRRRRCCGSFPPGSATCCRRSDSRANRPRPELRRGRASIAAVNPRASDFIGRLLMVSLRAGLLPRPWPCRRLQARGRQRRCREGDLRCRRGLRGREGVGGDRRLELPVRELHLMTQMLRVVAIDRAQHARQLVVGADPDLHQHVLVDERHHVGRDAADHLRLADVERDLEPVGDALVGIRHDDIRERKVDRRGVERRLQRGIDRRWRRRRRRPGSPPARMPSLPCRRSRTRTPGRRPGVITRSLSGRCMTTSDIVV